MTYVPGFQRVVRDGQRRGQIVARGADQTISGVIDHRARGAFNSLFLSGSSSIGNMRLTANALAWSSNRLNKPRDPKTSYMVAQFNESIGGVLSATSSRFSENVQTTLKRHEKLDSDHPSQRALGSEDTLWAARE